MDSVPYEWELPGPIKRQVGGLFYRQSADRSEMKNAEKCSLYVACFMQKSGGAG